MSKDFDDFAANKIEEMIERGYPAGYPLMKRGTPADVEAERAAICKMMRHELIDPSKLSPEGLEAWNNMAGESEKERADFSSTVGIIKFKERPEQNLVFARRREIIRARWQERPLPIASVFNFLPIPLFSDSTLPPLKYPGCIVPAAIGNTRYAIKTFTEGFIESYYGFENEEDKDQTLLAKEWSPLELAQAFSKTYIDQGVRVVLGDHTTVKDYDRELWGAMDEAICWTVAEFQNRDPRDRSRDLFERRLIALGVRI